MPPKARSNLAAFFSIIRISFLGKRLIGACSFHGFKGLEFFNGTADGLEVGEHPAQPAVVDIKHPTAFGLFGNGVHGLLFSAHEQDEAAVGHLFHHGIVGNLKELDGLLEIDDVDAVSGPEDIRLHLGVPAAGLMSGMGRPPPTALSW